MPDYHQLARWLLACQKHPDADGTIVLCIADATCMRTLGFATVVPGRWKVPPLPSELKWRYPALTQFATGAAAEVAGEAVRKTGLLFINADLAINRPQLRSLVPWRRIATDHLPSIARA